VIYHGEHKAEVDISEPQQIIPIKGDLVQCIGEVADEVTD
jgi:hypothetical protein